MCVHGFRVGEVYILVCNDYVFVLTLGRSKKKRSPPVPATVSPEATATPPTIAPIPASPSPPAVAAKAETNMNHATSPSSPNNKDTEDSPKDVAMNSDNINNTTSINTKEQVTSHTDTPTTIEEPVPYRTCSGRKCKKRN